MKPAISDGQVEKLYKAPLKHRVEIKRIVMEHHQENFATIVKYRSE